MTHQITGFPLPQHTSIQHYDIPQETYYHFFEYLKISEILCCSQTCKTWHALLLDPTTAEPFWKTLFQRTFDLLPELAPLSDFPLAYKRRHLFHRNLINNTFFCHTLQDGEKALVHTCLAVTNGKLVSSTHDRILQIWDLKTHTCTQTMDGILPSNPKNRCMLVFDGKLIAQESHDNKVGSLKMWDLTTGNCLKTFATNLPDCVTITKGEGKLIVMTKTNTIHIWDIESAQCLRTLQGNGQFQGTGHLLIFDGKLISSGEISDSLKVWDLKSGECLQTLPLESNACVSAFCAAHGKLFVSYRTSYDNRHLSAYDLQTFQLLPIPLGTDYGKIIPTKKGIIGCDYILNHVDILDNKADAKISLTGEKDLTNCITLDEKIFITGRTIRIWDLKAEMKPQNKLKGHSANVYDLTYCDGKLISASADGTIKIWDPVTPYELGEIADLFEQEDPSAMPRFSQLLPYVKNAIYAELYTLLKPSLKKDYWKCAEHAFLNRHKQSATPAQKAQAVRNYLNNNLIRS